MLAPLRVTSSKMARDQGSPSQDDRSRESAGESTNGPRQFNSELAKVRPSFSSSLRILLTGFASGL
jgi:hypothetical protein